MDHTYTKQQVLRMERRVLCALHFNLSYCCPLNFLCIFASIGQCSASVSPSWSRSSSRRHSSLVSCLSFLLPPPQVVWMARYLLELSLLEAQCVVFSPMQLAGAALCLARHLLLEPLTPEGEAAWYLASSAHLGR